MSSVCSIYFAIRNNNGDPRNQIHVVSEIFQKSQNLHQRHRRYNHNNMSGTLISSLVWVPRGRAAIQPKKYTLDEQEIERVGKLGGPGALEKLREEMEGLEVDPDNWEE
jgi:hypothetical protein